MNKLELKHLAAYLPYGLKLFNIENNTILKLVHGHNGYFSVEGVVSINFYSDSSCRFIENKHLKLILRPISDLSKTIEVNGEKFVPFNVLAKRASEYVPEKNLKKKAISELMGNYSQVQKLLEWHFDCFNLIPNDLAVDINTLNK